MTAAGFRTLSIPVAYYLLTQGLYKQVDTVSCIYASWREAHLFIIAETSCVKKNYHFWWTRDSVRRFVKFTVQNSEIYHIFNTYYGKFMNFVAFPVDFSKKLDKFLYILEMNYAKTLILSVIKHDSNVNK